jgi:hypothetical protein
MLVRRALKRYGDSYRGANSATLYTRSRLVHYVLLAIGVAGNDTHHGTDSIARAR